jgi:hypothetical protein
LLRREAAVCDSGATIIPTLTYFHLPAASYRAWLILFPFKTQPMLAPVIVIFLLTALVATDSDSSGRGDA